MRTPTFLGLPTSLLLLIAAHVEGQQARQPTAIRKLPLAASEKLLPEHFAFQESSPIPDNYQPAPFLTPREAVLAARLQLTVEEEQLLATNTTAYDDYVNLNYRGGRR
ncbi:hypothetical protein ACHAQA_001794 [Verticillium albo-atrum]